MSGKIPSFQSGSKFVIYVGNVELAYVQNLNMSDDMMLQSVGGIGSYSMHAIEPTGYMARGSMTITSWSGKSWDNAAGKMPGNINKPTSLSAAPTSDLSAPKKDHESDGNSLLLHAAFNPIYLLVSATFDIHVYNRTGVVGTVISEEPNYIVKDCRMATYNMGFSPGSFVNESVSFLARRIVDNTVDQQATEDALVSTPTTPPLASEGE